MAWKVVVDFDLCESNAICMGIVPEVFEVRDDNFLYVLQENPPDELPRSVSRPCSSARSRPSRSPRADGHAACAASTVAVPPVAPPWITGRLATVLAVSSVPPNRRSVAAPIGAAQRLGCRRQRPRSS